MSFKAVVKKKKKKKSLSENALKTPHLAEGLGKEREEISDFIHMD